MKIVNFVTMFFLTVTASALFAQPFRMGDKRPHERIEQLRKIRLIEMLDLKEEQSVRFFARLNEYEGAKRELMEEKMEGLDRLERLVRNRADEEEFEKVFPEVAAVNERIFEREVNFFNSLSDILSVEQRGKYLLFERHFEKELREAMREIQRRRHRWMNEP